MKTFLAVFFAILAAVVVIGAVVGLKMRHDQKLANQRSIFSSTARSARAINELMVMKALTFDTVQFSPSILDALAAAVEDGPVTLAEVSSERSEIVDTYKRVGPYILKADGEQADWLAKLNKSISRLETAK
jgi:hypothetical protein